MKQLIKYAAAAAMGAVATGGIVVAQTPAADPPMAVVSLYHAAPGQQLALAKWLARQDSVAQSIGGQPAQFYVHTDGDSWDFMTIGPATSRGQDDAFDAAARKMGVPTGAKAGLDLRRYINSHTDTFAMGPTTAAQYVAVAQ